MFIVCVSLFVICSSLEFAFALAFRVIRGIFATRNKHFSNIIYDPISTYKFKKITDTILRRKTNVHLTKKLISFIRIDTKMIANKKKYVNLNG
jgi:hypothetical protein